MFVITRERTLNLASIVGTLVFLAIASVAGFLGYEYYLELGWSVEIIFPFIMFLFMLSLAVTILYKGYFARSMFIFSPVSIEIKKRIGKNRYYHKDDFESTFIRNTITRDQYGRETRYQIDICLKKKSAFGRQAKDIALFTLDEKSSASALSGSLHSKDMEVVREEAYRIGNIIEIYWDIPFHV